MKKITFLLVYFCLVRFLQGQPISLHPQQPHIFVYKGKPTLLIGSGEHYGAVMNLGFDYKKYLATLRQDQQNITRIFVGAHREPANAFGIQRNTMSPTDEQYICAWEKTVEGKYDLNRWNEAYFNRLVDFVKEAAHNEVIVEINLFSSIYGSDIWSLSPLNPQNNIQSLPNLPIQKIYTVENEGFQTYLEAYTRKVVQTLNSFDNIFYEIQNEPWADNGVYAGTWNDFIQADMLKAEGNMWRTRIDAAGERSLLWQKRIASIIKEEEQNLPKKHLISQNYTNFQYPLATVDPQIDIYTFHYAFPKVVMQNYHWNKPICINESGFSGSKADPYRKQAWRFLLSGGAMYNNLDYSFTVGKEDGTDTTNIAPGHGSPAFRRQLQILHKFLYGFDLIKLRPDNQSIIASYGADTYCLSDKSTQWAIYSESYQVMSLLISLPKGKYKVSWIDVITGKEISNQVVESKKQAIKISPNKKIEELAIKIIKI